MTDSLVANRIISEVDLSPEGRARSIREDRAMIARFDRFLALEGRFNALAAGGQGKGEYEYTYGQWCKRHPIPKDLERHYDLEGPRYRAWMAHHGIPEAERNVRYKPNYHIERWRDDRGRAYESYVLRVPPSAWSW